MNSIIEWYQQQHYSIKAAVIGAAALIIGVFLTGFFTIIAAIIARPAPSEQVIVPTKMPEIQVVIPTLPPFNSTDQVAPSSTAPSPRPSLSPTPVVSNQNISPQTISVDDPFLLSIGNFINSLPSQAIPIMLGTLGICMIAMALVTLIRLIQREKDFVLVLAVLLELYILMRLLSWWGILATVLTGMATVMYAEATHFGKSHLLGLLLGWPIGGILGIGTGLIYLALMGQFISAYLLVGLIAFGAIGAVIGLITGAA